MGNYSQELKLLREQMARKRHLEGMQTDLQAQRGQLVEKAAELKTIMLKEQKDVNRLERGSLKAIFYEIVGKKGEKLEQEKREAYAARLKYDTAFRELEAVDSTLRRNKEELETLQTCRQNYERVLKQALEEIKDSGDLKAARVMETEEQYAILAGRIKELTEALDAGQKALDILEQVQTHLTDAEDWGTWDMFGGGLFADLAKYDAMDSAQRAVEQLQVQLRTLKTELVDVSMEADVQVNVDGFLEFADFFFDGLIADWAVMEQIQEATSRVRRTKGQLQDIMKTLRSMEADTRQGLTACEEKLSELAIT